MSFFKTFKAKLIKNFCVVSTAMLILFSSQPLNPAKVYSNAGTLNIAAGNGSQGYRGDTNFAQNAALSSPNGIAADRYGNFYIADTNNNVIRKVDGNGIISTVAGNGIAGYKGDNGKAIHAELNSPEAVAVDNNRNIYIADSNNNVIRKVDIYGNITTLAGNGISGYSGNGGKAINASLYSPNDVFVDNEGNVLVADTENEVIRRISRNGYISTVAGNNISGYKGDNSKAINAELSSPWGVTSDNNGNIYIADTGNNVIRKVDKKGIISTIAGNGDCGYDGDRGNAKAASFDCPCSVKVDTNGNIIIADYYNKAIREISSYGIMSTMTTMSGYPASIALDNNGIIYIADLINNRIMDIDENENNNNNDYYTKKTNLQTGDYIQFGKYNGEPIEWKVLDINSNGILVTTNKIISLKAFDAAESGISGSTGGSYTYNKDYQKFGNNTWGNSNIREWLNSEDDIVRYSTQPPTYNAVVYSCNPYNSEPGFLTNFTQNEINSINQVRNKTLQGKANIYTEDKVFLLSSDEWMQYLHYDTDKGAAYVTREAIAKSVYTDKNLNASDYWFYWLRDPYDYGNSSYLNYVYANGTVCHAQPNSDICGVRPAMYLKSANFIVNSSENGSEDNPYEIN